MRILLSLLLALTIGQEALSQQCRLCTVCGKYHCEPSPQANLAGLPRVSNRFRYPRAINPTLQARAQREAEILARSSFRENQRRWTRSGGSAGHPVGVPAGYMGGTGCSGPGGSGVIYTCEPKRALTLVAEAFAKSPIDGTWYASRIWRMR